MKANTSLAQNIYFLWPRELPYNNKIPVCAHKHKTLKILSLTTGNVSLALCSTILATLVARECRTFCNLETYQMINILWGSLELAHNGPSNLNSRFS
jgi:hypothetical protein